MAMFRMLLQDYAPKRDHDGEPQTSHPQMVFSDGFHEFQQKGDFCSGIKKTVRP